MNSILLAVCLMSAPQIHHNCIFNDEIKSKQYVKIQLKTGEVDVPIINGFMPEIEEFIYNDGTIQRVFRYDKKTIYSGQKYDLKKVYPSPKPIPTKPVEIKTQVPNLQKTQKISPYRPRFVVECK